MSVMSQFTKRIIIKSPRFRVATTLIPLCPDFYGDKKTKVGNFYLLPLGGVEGFYKGFQTAKVLQLF